MIGVGASPSLPVAALVAVVASADTPAAAADDDPVFDPVSFADAPAAAFCGPASLPPSYVDPVGVAGLKPSMPSLSVRSIH